MEVVSTLYFNCQYLLYAVFAVSIYVNQYIYCSILSISILYYYETVYRLLKIQKQKLIITRLIIIQLDPLKFSFTLLQYALFRDKFRKLEFIYLSLLFYDSILARLYFNLRYYIKRVEHDNIMLFDLSKEIIWCDKVLVRINKIPTYFKILCSNQ